MRNPSRFEVKNCVIMARSAHRSYLIYRRSARTFIGQSSRDGMFLLAGQCLGRSQQLMVEARAYCQDTMSAKRRNAVKRAA